MDKIQKLLAYPFARIAIFLLISFLIMLAVASLYLIDSLPFLKYIAAFNLFIGCFIGNFLIEHFRKSSKWYYFGLKFNRKAWRDFLHGFLIVIVVCSLFFGGYFILGAEIESFEGFSTDSLSFLIFYQIFILLFFAAQEELMVRGVLLQSLIQQFGNIIAIIIVSLLFMIGHFFNPEINAIAMINTFLAGVVFAYMYIKTKSLFLPISVHFFWNFMVVIALDSELSGFDMFSQLKQLAWHIPESQLNTILLGGNYGIESGVLATIILILLIIYTNKFVKPSKTMEKLLKIRNIEEQKLIGKYNEEV